MCEEGGKGKGNLLFFSAPPANSQQILSAPGLEPGEPFFDNSYVLLNTKLQHLIKAKGTGLVWMQEAMECQPLAISVLIRASWEGPRDTSRDHISQTGGSAGWSWLPEVAAAESTERLGGRLRGGNSRPVYVSCPSWTQAEFAPSRFPGGTCAARLYYGLEGLQDPFLTQTLWNAGPHHCSLGGTATLNFCCQFTIVVTAKIDRVLSRCQGLF